MLKQARDAAKEKIDKSPDPDKALTMLNNDSSFMLDLNKHLKDDEQTLYLPFESEADKKKAISLGNKILKKYPDDIDVLVRLALIKTKSLEDEVEELLKLKEKYAPKFLKENNIDLNKGAVNDDDLYFWLKNRPFLRLLYEIGYDYLLLNKTQEAFHTFKFLYFLNNQDHLGARDYLACLAFWLNDDQMIEMLSKEGLVDLSIIFINAL